MKVPRNYHDYETATVRFTYDVSGLLEVEVTVDSTGQKAALVITKLAGEMRDPEIRAALKAMEGLKVPPREDAEDLYLRARIKAAYATVRPDLRQWVQGLLAQLDAGLKAQDKAALTELRAALRKALDAVEAGHVT